ncbi:uncharacterized protein LOC112045636 [Bicyclus anynana]|uniref:Uncharacterized protein LOC112045636 n=1 Tax=Bicyclus anynana TaxID=110368 RepID=A0A6J1MXU7_BICAN|nr:uncharacterized protein LOC112045636 [Bicyclus anynana]
MEFTPVLSAFQGIIITTDSVHSFSKLKARGGNEEKIEYVVGCLKNFLQKKGYLTKDCDSIENIKIMRKFAFYICLNADLLILEDLVSMDGIAFLIWTVPTISKCLMCEMYWNLDMEKFIYEILAFTSPLLSIEVAEALLDHFKYFNPTECMGRLKMLSLGCYRLICRLIYFNLKGDEIIRSYNNFLKCLKYFVEPPNASKLERLSTDEEFKFIGSRLCEMLSVVSGCFSHYTAPQKFKPSDYEDLYELSYRDGITINKQFSAPISQCKNSDVIANIDNCHVALLDKFQTLLMEISVEIFCAWSEFEENGKSMQQSIGESCYKVLKELSDISCVSDHAVIAMLQQISCKPMNMVQVVNKSDTAVIIENINKEDDDSNQWIKALIFKDKLCEDVNLLEQVTSHLDILNELECYNLFKILYKYIKENSFNKEMQLALAIKVFERCSTGTKYDILDEHFSDACFNDNLQVPEFKSMMTEIFNKLISSQKADMSDVLTVFLQNPREVYGTIFNLANVNMHQADIMIKVMKCVEMYSQHYYNKETEPCMILAIKEAIGNCVNEENNHKNFIHLLKNLKSSNTIPGAKLLLLIIMPYLHSGLLQKNMNQICFQCKLLQAAYRTEDLQEYRAPTLAMLAQVLDTVRWKMNTYAVQAPLTLDIVLQLQSDLNTQDLTEKESVWLKSKLRNINPLNMYYFRHLWNPPGNTFVEVVSGMHIHKEMDLEHLSLWLSKALSSTILQEWYQIWDSLSTVFGNVKIFDIFHNALLLLCVAEKSNHTESTKSCLMYCMQSFVATTRYKFFKLPLNDSQVTTVFIKFAAIANLANDNDIEELAVIFLALFAYMAANKENFSEDLPLTLLRKFKHKKFIETIGNLFQPKLHFSK